MQELFAEGQSPDASSEPDEASPARRWPGSLVEKYDGTRLTDRTRYIRLADVWVSPTDPDATLLSPLGGYTNKLGYHTHYVVDGGKARIILACLVTPASIHDDAPMLDLVRWARFRWQIRPRIAVGDGRYGTTPNIVGLEMDGVRAYLPRHAQHKRHKVYPREMFHYDAEEDCYICPQGHKLRHGSYNKAERKWIYYTSSTICKACPVRPACTTSKRGVRMIQRSVFQEFLDRAQAYRETEAYKKAMRKRKVWVEPLFGEAKQWHEARKFRLRRLEKVNIAALMIASGQNVKRLISHKGWGKHQGPAGGSAALAVVPSFSFS